MPKKNFKSITIFVLIILVFAPVAAINYANAGEKQGFETAENGLRNTILKDNYCLRKDKRALEENLQNVMRGSEIMFKENYLLEKANKSLEEKLQAQNQIAPAVPEENTAPQKAIKSLEEKLQVEKNKNAKLVKKIKKLSDRMHNYTVLQENYRELSAAAVKLKKDKSGLEKENRQIKEQAALLAEQLRREKALLNKELGTAYVQNKIYDKAIEAYNRSLEAEPLDAQVHYNLGLLCRSTRADKKKAIFHLKKYLDLNPAAANKKDVLYLIEMINSDD